MRRLVPGSAGRRITGASQRGAMLQRRYTGLGENRAYYNEFTNVPANDTVALDWTKAALADPLDLTAPAAPKIVVEGVYCVSVFCNAHTVSGVALPTGASFKARLQIDAGAIGGFQGVADGIWTQPSAARDIIGPLSLTWFAPKNAEVSVLLTNLDGSDHDFYLAAFVQQIV